MELFLRCAYCTVSTFGISGNNYTYWPRFRRIANFWKIQGYSHLILFQIFQLHQLDWIVVHFPLCQHNARPLDIIGPMLTRYGVPDSRFQMGSILANACPETP